MNNNLKYHTAFYMGILLKKNKLDPVMLLEYFIERYKNSSKNEKLSFSKILINQARKEAELSWFRQKKKERLSFFDGIPIVWKDLIDIVGYPAFAGSKLIKKIRKNQKVEDAQIVTLARKSGLISLAKTRTVEFAFGGLGLNNSYKLPNNVMIKNNVVAPGGSSTGSATSVFSGLAPLSVGTDTAGSVRIPAAWQSLIGFKPSANQISTKGILPLSASNDTVGTICKSVKDTQILFNILSEKSYRFISELNKNIKIGFVYNFNYEHLDDLSKNKIEDLITKISQLGIVVKKDKIQAFDEINQFIKHNGSIVNFEAWKYWGNKIKGNLNKIDQNVVNRFLLGKSMSKEKVDFLKRKILLLKEKVYSKFDEYDFLLMPTLSIAPPSINILKNKEKYHLYNNFILDNTRVANIFNLCCISLPLNSKNRRWLSVSLASKQYNDEQLLVIAEKIESILK